MKIKKNLFILSLFIGLIGQAQDYDIYILFEENEFSIKNNIGSEEDEHYIEHFFIKKNDCDCDEEDIYNYSMRNGKLLTGIIATSKNNLGPQLHLFYKIGVNKKKRIKKNKIKDNIIKSAEIPYSQWDSLIEVIDNASKVYILTQHSDRDNYYISTEVFVGSEF